MTKLSEMPAKAQLALVVVLAALVTAGAYYFVMKDLQEANKRDRLALQAKKAENDQLRPYETKLQELNQQIELLKQQLAIQARIVPDEKEAEEFMHLMQGTASAAGIEIRRYTAKPTATREFYTEVPFEMDVDGPYYSMLRFFERVGKLERIINIGGLQMAGLKSDKSPVKKRYQYAPEESVVANCTATTFFSHDAPAAPAPAPAAAKK
jgi:type IV pilus assembly protein PilO